MRLLLSVLSALCFECVQWCVCVFSMCLAGVLGFCVLSVYAVRVLIVCVLSTPCNECV